MAAAAGGQGRGRGGRAAAGAAAGRVCWLATARFWGTLVFSLCAGMFAVLARRDRRAGRRSLKYWLHTSSLGPLRVATKGKLPAGCIVVSMHYTILDWVWSIVSHKDASFAVGTRPFVKWIPLSLSSPLYLPPLCFHFFDGRNHMLPHAKGYDGFRCAARPPPPGRPAAPRPAGADGPRRDWIEATDVPWVYPAGLGTKFRSGSFRASKELGKPIVPVKFRGVRESFNMFCLMVRPFAEIEVEFGEPLRPEDFADDAALLRAAQAFCMDV